MGSHPNSRARYTPVCLAVSGIFGLLTAGCGDNGITPSPNLRFGQIGEVRVTVVTPLFFQDGPGELQQILTWTSTGAWQLRESISYRGLPPGDENLKRNEGNPATYASGYFSLITQLNESPGLTLFIPELSPEVNPECGPGQSRVSFMIRDEVREETETWIRCAQGSLGNLNVLAAGPDPAAGRVIQAAVLVVGFTQGSEFQSAYSGSIPFGTLDRGEDSGAGLLVPKAFISFPYGSGNEPPDWQIFWRAHRGDPAAVPPEVDWSREMVLVAAVGTRTEAGDSVEIRRVLQTGEGTQVTLFERVPGNFCSPAARIHSPVHIVVAPLTLQPLRFSEIVTERVHCGI